MSIWRLNIAQAAVKTQLFAKEIHYKTSITQQATSRGSY